MKASSQYADGEEKSYQLVLDDLCYQKIWNEKLQISSTIKQSKNTSFFFL